MTRFPSSQLRGARQVARQPLPLSALGPEFPGRYGPLLPAPGLAVIGGLKDIHTSEAEDSASLRLHGAPRQHRRCDPNVSYLVRLCNYSNQYWETTGRFILNEQREGTRESVVSGLAVCGLPLSQGVKEAKSRGFVPAQHGLSVPIPTPLPQQTARRASLSPSWGAHCQTRLGLTECTPPLGISG